MALLIIPSLKGDPELEVRTATYGPGIDQSQHAKSVSHIIIIIIPLSAQSSENLPLISTLVGLISSHWFVLVLV